MPGGAEDHAGLLARGMKQAEIRATQFVMSRPALVRVALRARAAIRGVPEASTGELAATQIYRGYDGAQETMLRSMVTGEARQETDRIVDGFGQQTLLECIPFASGFDLARLTHPIPDDGYHAEAAEYIALADAVRRAEGRFCIAELGAGWGPWVGLGGVLARNRGIAEIELIGVEALPARFALLEKHLHTNGLRPLDGDRTVRDGVSCRLFNGAATVTRSEVFFPDVGIIDMGSAVSETGDDRDYRGRRVRNLRVQGYPLDEILGSSRIDLLHIDVQGSEVALVEANLDLIARQVDAMMIGTHSRVIEGALIDLLYRNGWQLELEKPCRVAWTAHPVSQQAMTETDGCQYWRRAA
jgi:Methyltransferase FkbM domain